MYLSKSHSKSHIKEAHQNLTSLGLLIQAKRLAQLGYPEEIDPKDENVELSDKFTYTYELNNPKEYTLKAQAQKLKGKYSSCVIELNQKNERTENNCK